MTDLPIELVLPALREALRAGNSAVLQAPPGAGKTTRVPLALLDEPWLDKQRIVMLEPRRLAARAAAQRMATMLDERVGQSVGYRVRMDSRVGPKTRIEVVTEGVLTRLLQADPALEGIGLVIFDEFHERSVHADLGLALCLQSRALLREELRILVMSATLDGEPIAQLLGDAPILSSEGRQFPVAVCYRDPHDDRPLESAVERATLRALAEQPGDVLVFLPGQAEIRRAEARLAEAGLGPAVQVSPLYGNLPREKQDRAIEPSPPGWRKVVLATSIAETSLTIEGVGAVVDSGRMRVPRFSPRTGMTRLETLPVTHAAAEQRRGRAGRLGPGTCYRLWTEPEQHHRLPHGTPEILEADLAPLALELAAWGVSDPGELRWLDPPPPAAFAQARELLAELDALDARGTLTPHGRRMAGLALHPRLAHLALRGRELGHGPLACDLVALLSERYLLRGDGGPPDADLRLRLEVLRAAERRNGSGPASIRESDIDRGTLRRVLSEARHWRRRLEIPAADYEIETAGLLLAFAYPDRIAQRRTGQTGRFLLRNGRGAAFPSPQPLSEADWLAIAELSGEGRESRIFLAAPVEMAELQLHFAEQIETKTSIEWDGEVVRARRRERLGALVLRDAPLPNPDPEAISATLLDAIRREGLDVLPWSGAARHLQQRLGFLHRLDPSWPDVSDSTLFSTLPDWLGPYLYGIRRRAELQQLNLPEILLGFLPWERRAALDELAPTHYTVPSGSGIAIDYADPATPTLAVRLQEMFGLSDTPRIARGTVPLTLHLLSPARRPVQVTRDLASFWRDAYFEVRKDLRGRYPKHFWPDDPLEAVPTRRTRPRS